MNKKNIAYLEKLSRKNTAMLLVLSVPRELDSTSGTGGEPDREIAAQLIGAFVYRDKVN